MIYIDSKDLDVEPATVGASSVFNIDIITEDANGDEGQITLEKDGCITIEFDPVPSIGY